MRRVSIAAVIVFIMGGSALGQVSGGDFEIRRSVVAAGGGAMSGDDFTHVGTAGQMAVGSSVSDGGDPPEFEVRSGAFASCGACQLYGDVVVTCVIDVDDILFILDAFIASSLAGDIEPCGGDNDIDVDDILAELDSFGGIYACPHPCPP